LFLLEVLLYQLLHIEKYAQSTNRLKTESIAGIIADNSTTPRISNRLKTVVSIPQVVSHLSTAFKQKRQAKYDIKDIIARLEFSGVLTLDEYIPRRADNYALIAGDTTP
jgi:hypothetical protein